MTDADTIRPGWPTFRSWQVTRVAASGDLRRTNRVLARWFVRDMTPAMRHLMPPLRKLATAAAQTAEAFGRLVRILQDDQP